MNKIEKHSIVLIINATYSMLGERILAINHELYKWLKDIRENDVMVDKIAIMACSDKISVLLDFTPIGGISQAETPYITAKGDTKMSEAMIFALNYAQKHNNGHKTIFKTLP